MCIGLGVITYLQILTWRYKVSFQKHPWISFGALLEIEHLIDGFQTNPVRNPVSKRYFTPMDFDLLSEISNRKVVKSSNETSIQAPGRC